VETFGNAWQSLSRVILEPLQTISQGPVLPLFFPTLRPQNGCAQNDLPPIFAPCEAGVRRCGRGDTEQEAPMTDDGSAEDLLNTTAAADEAGLKLEEFLPYLFNVVSSLTSQALSSIYAERYRIGVPEWRVLVTLGQYGIMTGKAIGAHSHMHKTKVSRAVALLERRKLVTRRANKADMREAFLSLTPAGRAIYQDLAPIAREFVARLVEDISPSDHAAFERVLTLLIDRAAVLASERTTKVRAAG
jgi:DNA-binding MarR family transcriptional regulator